MPFSSLTADGLPGMLCVSDEFTGADDTNNSQYGPYINHTYLDNYGAAVDRCEKIHRQAQAIVATIGL